MLAELIFEVGVVFLGVDGGLEDILEVELAEVFFDAADGMVEVLEPAGVLLDFGETVEDDLEGAELGKAFFGVVNTTDDLEPDGTVD